MNQSDEQMKYIHKAIFLFHKKKKVKVKIYERKGLNQDIIVLFHPQPLFIWINQSDLPPLTYVSETPTYATAPLKNSRIAIQNTV